MSTIGCATLVSANAHATSIAAAAINRPTTNGDVQPCGPPSVRATKSAMSPPDSSTAPTMSGRAGARTGDSGMNRQTRIRATRPMTADTTNSQRQLRLSITRPAVTMPSPPPTPSVEETVPIVTLHLSSGNSSRMIA